VHEVRAVLGLVRLLGGGGRLMGAQGWIIAIIIVCAVLIAARRPTRIAIIAVILIGITMYAFNNIGGIH
jgi:hypothetical protein